MPEADPNRIIHCIKLKQDLPGLKTPPFRGDFGQQIFERVSKEAWDQWLKESVRIINTYRVDLASREGTQFMMDQMKIWFGFAEGEVAATAWRPPEESKA